MKESISELNISSQFAKLLSTEGINRSNVNKRIEECFKCNSISRSFINHALKEYDINPEGFDIDNPKSNKKIKDTTIKSIKR